MDKANHPFLAAVDDSLRANSNRLSPTETHACIADQRVARLLVILKDIDQFIGGLEEVPQKELSDLISRAILTCGFVDPVEAKYAIAAVLHAIEDKGAPACS